MRFASRVLGSIAKIAWAFLFQERFSPVPHWAYKHFVLKAFAFVTPYFNHMIDVLTGMPYAELGIYPGSTYCNQHSPHAIWHQ